MPITCYSGWVPNTALQELTSERAAELLTDKVKKKELREAFELAIQQPSLDHFKEVLLAHEESIRQDAEDQLEQKKQKADAKKKRNSVVAPPSDEDVDMADVPEDEPVEKPKSAKKRKAEEAAVSVPCRNPALPYTDISDRLPTDTAARRVGQEAQDQAHHFLHPQSDERRRRAQGCCFQDQGQG